MLRFDDLDKIIEYYNSFKDEFDSKSEGAGKMIAKISQNQIQEVNYHESSKQETVADVKYQNIIYYMDNKIKKVSQKQKVQIDFVKATSEMGGLNWNYEENFIGFDNLAKHECVQFIRQGHDKLVCRSSNRVRINMGRVCMVQLF